MSDLNLENIVGFKAVDKDGNEQNVTVDEMVDIVSTRMVMALSETSTFAAAAATGNDVYENELPTVTDAANVRVLQSSGDAAKMTMQSLASKLGGLLPMASDKRSGLMGIMQFRGSSSYSAGIKSGDFVKLFNLKQYMVCVFDVIAGDTTLVHNSIASIYVNNRCSDKFSIKSKLLWGTLTKLYAKMETDKSVTFYIKIPDVSYPSMKLSFSTPMEYWEGNVDISVDNSVTESDLNIVM